MGSGMPPPSRTSSQHSPVSSSIGTHVRHRYSALIPRSSRLGRSHHGNLHHISTTSLSPMSGISRGMESSRESSSSSHPFNVPAGAMRLGAGSQYPLGSQNVPPFDPTKSFHHVVTATGASVEVEIQAKIDKGFFMAEQDWTCYRRNYFSVACCYVLRPEVNPSSQPLFLVHGGSKDRIQSFSVLIVAKVDGEDGKSVELVQHTPKRDKGPMTAPELMELAPHPAGSVGLYPSSLSISPNSQLSSEFDTYAGGAGSQTQTSVVFDRIQFKKATANNGKRRAAQQYFHIVVELHAKVLRGKSTETQTVKVAHSVSAQMVVRGRSPGHYSDERRGGSTGMGRGGASGGNYSASQRDAGSARPSGEGHGSRSGGSYSGSGQMSSSGYQSQHMSMAHSPPGNHSIPSSSSSGHARSYEFDGRHAIPTLTMEEEADIESFPGGYQYYPSPLYEIPSTMGTNGPILSLLRHNSFKQVSTSSDSNVGHVTLSTGIPADYYTPPVKVEAEHHGETSLRIQSKNTLPLSPPGGDTMLRGCRRFQGLTTSRGFYPAMPAQ